MDTGQKSQYQCQECGSLVWAKEPLDIEGDLFVKMPCEHCHRETNHLWVGDREEDLYIYYNANADPRYY